MSGLRNRLRHLERTARYAEQLNAQLDAQIRAEIARLNVLFGEEETDKVIKALAREFWKNLGS